MQRVLLDLDGVIRDFIKGLDTVYKKCFPEHHIKRVESHYLNQYYPIGNDIEAFMRYFHPEMVAYMPPYEGAIEVLEKWAEKFELVIVTSQWAWSVSDTFNWLKQYQLPVSEVIITGEKEKIDGIALIDDFPQNLDRFRQTGRLSVCFDQPWNQEWTGARVKNLNQYFETIEIYLKKNGD